MQYIYFAWGICFCLSVTQYNVRCLIHHPLWLSSDCYTMGLKIHKKQEEAPFSSGMHQWKQDRELIGIPETVTRWISLWETFWQ